MVLLRPYRTPFSYYFVLALIENFRTLNVYSPSTGSLRRLTIGYSQPRHLDKLEKKTSFTNTKGCEIFWECLQKQPGLLKLRSLSCYRLILLEKYRFNLTSESSLWGSAQDNGWHYSVYSSVKYFLVIRKHVKFINDHFILHGLDTVLVIPLIWK